MVAGIFDKPEDRMSTQSANVRLEAGSVVEVTDGSGGTKQAKIAARYETWSLDDAAIIQAIADGAILADPNTVVKVGDEYVVYTKLEAMTVLAALVLLAGVGDLVIGEDGQPERGKPSVTSNFNYGADLNAKRAVRQLHESKVKGPERTVNATIANLVKLGFTKEQAEAMVKSAPAVSGQ